LTDLRFTLHWASEASSCHSTQCVRRFAFKHFGTRLNVAKESAESLLQIDDHNFPFTMATGSISNSFYDDYLDLCTITSSMIIALSRICETLRTQRRSHSQVPRLLAQAMFIEHFLNLHLDDGLTGELG
jgi:hypothetical protein